MRTLYDVGVGSKVILVEDYRRSPEEVVVTRVGRTLIGVQRWGREMTFYKENGVDSHHYAGNPTTIQTPEQYEDEQLRKKQLRRLDELGWVRNYRTNSYSTSKLARIIAVLEET